MNDSHIASILNRVHKVTFVEMLATLAFAMMLVSIVILIEVRTSFFQRFIAPDPQIVFSPVPARLAMSPGSTNAVVQFAAEHPTLAVVGVMSVDLSDNTREVMLMIYNDPALAEQNSKLTSTKWPLFTASVENNSDISSLFSGEFACSPARQNMLMEALSINGAIRTTCRVPIPPYYGRLTGYLVMHSTEELSIYEVDQLRTDALRLSINMYYANAPRPALWSAN